jgi:hypothetical protein
VERLGVDGDRRRDEADVACPRGGPGRDEHGVQPATDPVGALVALKVVVGLQVEAVLDRDKVEQAVLGPLRQADPVRRGQETVRLGVRLAPRRRVPAGTIEGDG